MDDEIIRNCVWDYMKTQVETKGANKKGQRAPAAKVDRDD